MLRSSKIGDVLELGARANPRLFVLCMSMLPRSTLPYHHPDLRPATSFPLVSDVQ